MKNTFCFEQACRSHTTDELVAGLNSGLVIWLFDGDAAERNDVLLCKPGVSEDELRDYIEDMYFVLDDIPVPANLWDIWTLEGPITKENMEDYYQ